MGLDRESKLKIANPSLSVCTSVKHPGEINLLCRQQRRYIDKPIDLVATMLPLSLCLQDQEVVSQKKRIEESVAPSD
jgi:hypothetical protein